MTEMFANAAGRAPVEFLAHNPMPSLISTVTCVDAPAPNKSLISLCECDNASTPHDLLLDSAEDPQCVASECTLEEALILRVFVHVFGAWNGAIPHAPNAHVC